MIKAVIFDLNGVFIRSPKLSDRFFERFGIPPEQFLPALKEVMTKVRKPNAGDLFAHWKPYFDVWGLQLTKKEFEDFWFHAETEHAEMIDLARNLRRQGLKIMILSNNFSERSAYYDEAFPFLKELADDIYYSWQTGFVKPDPRAYQKVLEDHHLKPEECLYIDDSEKNIEVAASLGLHSILFENPEHIQDLIEIALKNKSRHHSDTREWS